MVEYVFRFAAYVMFGLVMEVVFSVGGIEFIAAITIPNKRLPKKHLEGFVSLYMVPLYGFGILFGVEAIAHLIGPLCVVWRYLIWAVVFGLSEAGWGWLLDRALGFYAWDYYALSKYRVFGRGYTLWTLLPLWGLVGLIVERYVGLMLYLSPYVVGFVGK